MYPIAKPILLKCETPLHAGSGSDLNFVDLPIQRERHTSFPKIEGSSIKGSLREHFRRNSVSVNEINALFGSGANPGETRQAGALGLSDARILLFPVRSVKGLFAWITCPEVLQRVNNDFRLCGMDDAASHFDFSAEDGLNELVATNSEIVNSEDKVILEEFAFKTKASQQVDKMANYLADHLFDESKTYWKNKLKTSIVILNDDDFRDFTNLSTEVITRTKISPETGTVESGALFTEEYLPVETILYSLVFASNERLDEESINENTKMDSSTVFGTFNGLLDNKSVIQLGGSASIGKGILSTTILNG